MTHSLLVSSSSAGLGLASPVAIRPECGLLLVPSRPPSRAAGEGLASPLAIRPGDGFLLVPSRPPSRARLQEHVELQVSCVPKCRVAIVVQRYVCLPPCREGGRSARRRATLLLHGATQSWRYADLYLAIIKLHAAVNRPCPRVPTRQTRIRASSSIPAK